MTFNPPDFNFESPFTISEAENSPITSLATDLSGAHLGKPARRKLAMSSPRSDSSMVISPVKSPKRLLRANLRFSGGSGGGNASLSGLRRSFTRRLSQLGGDENSNPQGLMRSPVKRGVVSPSKFTAVRRLRQPLEDHDPNSQDSGFGISDDSKSVSSDFPFAQPNGLAPRRSVNDSPQRSSLHSSSGSSGNTDDGFGDFISPLEDEEAQLPSGLGSLIKNPIINHGLSEDPAHYQSFRQAMHQENISYMSPIVEEKSKKRASTTALDITPLSKRHKALTECSTPRSAQNVPTTPSPTSKQNTLFQYGFKRLSEPRPLLSHSVSLEEPLTTSARPKFRHCLSESEAVIKQALHRSSEEDLIGDFSRSFVLPLVPGVHQDLKSITPTTLAKLINGEFSDTVASYQIIDCRYPYEFEGGHIKNAVNLYTKDQVMREFLENRAPASSAEEGSKRQIVVFHCEFSSERGPGLSRFLRSKDRENNPYPALHHPELYLLEGGYKAFYNTHGELCEPCAYRRMLDADKEELQRFRTKSKTWSGDKPGRVIKRSTSFKRLGL